MNDKMWRFVGNNYATETGLDTADMETFKKDPISSLAREICQNSIDARAGKDKVVIEFHSFEIKKDDIPGRERIEKEMISCEEYQKRRNNPKDKEQLERMIKEVGRDRIQCLRISDYNTTGLLGVASREETPFYLLTKGSGLSNKVGTSGGSKGIGKYASFVASAFNTVFYSTYTKEQEQGYIGICKLCSTTIEGSDEKTQGIGYYGIDEKNNPILEQISIDPNFKRKSFGTDIYILGFKNEETWEKEIVTKVLDSFLSAIYYDELEVIINDKVINKQSLSGIVYNDELITKKFQSSIKSQYILLNDPTVYKEKIQISEYGEVELYLKSFSKDESYLATNECVMIRYPYMKITSLRGISSIPCSAMCIIPNNQLNKILREIENPQHTDWELRRIDDSAKRAEVNAIYRELKSSIVDFVQSKLALSENDEIDVEGAGDYLPSVDSESGLGSNEEITITEQPKVVKKLKNKVKDKIGVYEDSEGMALQPDIGDHEEGEGSPVPEGTNSGRTGEPHDSDQEEGLDGDGNKDIMKIAQLSGMSYRYFVTDKKNGKYVISFTSLYDEENCDLEMSHLDDGGNKYKTQITNCSINGSEGYVENGIIKGFELKNGVKYKIEVDTDLDDYYACEVKIYANR